RCPAKKIQLLAPNARSSGLSDCSSLQSSTCFLKSLPCRNTRQYPIKRGRLRVRRPKIAGRNIPPPHRGRKTVSVQQNNQARSMNWRVPLKCSEVLQIGHLRQRAVSTLVSLRLVSGDRALRTQ